MTAGEWCAAHRDDIARLARWLFVRWPVPSAVSVEDVEQELRIGAVLAFRVHDPRGMPLDNFVRWRAVQHAKTWLHVQRNALRRSGAAPSRHALCVAAAGMDSVYDGSGADVAVEFLEVLRLALAACRTERERVCLGALLDARLDAQEAASAVLGDPEMRRICRATSPRQARALVRQSAQRLMEVAAWQQ